ncbi:hypothetical protein [uncultured Rothia sp.]|uniref:hypothetical protein n=1 Tax=uncultured Rothia sp. TaxID=316088 RepID=UPI002604D7AE|nr:hypothetical protein [uncultured Rothia sp.]
MTDSHSEHLTLISSSVFNAEDVGETLESIEQIYGSEYGPYDKGEVGFYVSEAGCENIDKVVEKVSSDIDMDYMRLVYELSNIPVCNESRDRSFSKCNSIDCLSDSEESEYLCYKESSVYISANRANQHLCEKFSLYPVGEYSVKYSHRKQRLAGSITILNIEDILLNEVGRSFEGIIFAENFFNNDVFKTRGEDVEICKSIFDHLCVIDDFAYDVWLKFNSTRDRQSLLNSRGVSVSPESPEKHRNKKYMKRRDIPFRFRGEDIIFQCEWHSKITGDGGRIYFYVPSPTDVSKYPEIQEKVLIGKVCHHL